MRVKDGPKLVNLKTPKAGNIMFVAIANTKLTKLPNNKYFICSLYIPWNLKYFNVWLKKAYETHTTTYKECKKNNEPKLIVVPQSTKWISLTIIFVKKDSIASKIPIAIITNFILKPTISLLVGKHSENRAKKIGRIAVIAKIALFHISALKYDDWESEKKFDNDHKTTENTIRAKERLTMFLGFFRRTINPKVRCAIIV